MKSATALVFFGLLVVIVSAKGRKDELKITSRITNGSPATRRQFPYQARVGLHTETDIRWCGGSVISNHWILCAAHCIDIVTTGVDVVVGAWSRTNTMELGQQRMFVPKSDIIVHKDWNPETIKNDISLIKLRTPIKFDEYVQRINLPKMVSPRPTYVGEYGIASGFGRINDSVEKVYPDILQWMKVPIMPNSVCNLSYPEFVRNSNICVDTKGGTSTCFGDSGGPLVLASDKPVLIGIDSFGNSTCETGDPAVFTRVTSYLGWIEKNTRVV